jgi:ABC-2 type transport system permease protein
VLTDALSSETYKLFRNRWTAFWSYGFAPALTFVATLGFYLFMMAKVPAELRAQPQDLSGQLMLGAFGTKSPPYFVAMLFSMLGAAVVFAGDYRWETWRLIAPRNGRNSLIGSKIILVTLCIVGVMLALLLVNVLLTLFSALVNHSPITWTMAEAKPYWLILVSMFGVSCLQLIQASSLVALAAVATRSLIGALLAPVFIGIVQLAIQGVAQQQPDIPLYQLMLLPGLSADILRQHIGGVTLFQTQTVGGDQAREALAGLLLWIIVGFGGAWGLFLKQDLSKE